MQEYDPALIASLEEKARLLRRHVLKMTHAARSGHPGGSLSCTDVITTLYFHVLNVDPKRPDWPERDRFVLSKGHAAPILYAALAEKGFIPVEELTTLRKLGSRLQGHPERGAVPGVEACAGAEGQGLSFGIGVALAARLDKNPARVYVLLGDGENDVGQTWEAVMAARHLKLDNLTVIIDRNGLQQEGSTERIMGLEPLAEKWMAFRWRVIGVDGHDIRQLLRAFDEAKATRDRPTCILAVTVKGKGVSFMENIVKFHGSAPTDDELKRALAELGETS